MKFKINNDLFKIRKINKKDSKDYFEIRINNKEEIYISDDPFKTLEEAKMHLNKMYFTKEAKKNSKGYAIIKKDNNKMIGIVEIHSYDINTHSASLGYILDKRYWNLGIMSNACKLVVNHSFKKYNYFYLSAITKDKNYASIKILNKLGFDLIQIKEKESLTYLYFKLKRKDFKK